MARPVSSLPKPDVLLVEGQNDKHVVRHLHERRGLRTDFCIRDKGGIDELLSSIVPEIKAPGRRAVGILVDANDDLAARWEAVTSQLLKAGIRSPKAPGAAGTIMGEKPRIGVWLMPDNQSSGELEDFVAEMVPQDDPVWPLSKGYIEGIPKAHRKFSDKKKRRAEVYSWLAARQEPRLMGLAIRAKDLEVDGALSLSFATWLAKLFG